MRKNESMGIFCQLYALLVYTVLLLAMGNEYIQRLSSADIGLGRKCPKRMTCLFGP